METKKYLFIFVAAFFVALLAALSAFSADNGDFRAKLKNKNAVERSRAADEAVRNGGVDGVKAVREALKTESNKEARLLMINSLGRSRTPEATDDLKSGLASTDKELRLATACSLAQLGSSDGIRELEAVATSSGEQRGRRAAALQSLASIKTDASIDILGRVLNDQDFAIRLQAVVSLGKIGTKRALGLVATKRSDPDERVSQIAESFFTRVKMK